MPRSPVTLANLRALLERERSLPTHEETYSDIERALDRLNIGKQRWKYGQPTLPSRGESIFDFRDIGQYPNAYLAPFDQPITTRGFPKSARPMLRPNTMKSAIEEALAGAKTGRHAWYDLSPIHSFINEEIDPANVEHAQRLMKLGVPLSQQTSVPAEFLGAAYQNELIRRKGLEALGDPESLDYSRFGGGASPRDKLLNAARMLSGEPTPPTQVKLAAYEQNRMGNLFPATLDSKILRMLDLSDKAHPAQKGAAAAALKSVAARTGTMPAKLQAMMWGKGEGFKETGSADEPLAAVINNLIYRSALKQGIDPKKHAIDVFSGEANIPFRPGELGYADGGMVKRMRGVLARIADQMQEAMPGAPSKFSTEIGHVPRDYFERLHNANDLLMQNPEALKAYVASQAPEMWKPNLMNLTDPQVEGSGRRVLFADNPYGGKTVVKVAQQPRALRENEMEGLPDLAKHGFQPLQDFSSDLADVVGVQRIPVTPNALLEHENFMRPMAERFDEAVAQGHSPYTAHLEDFALEQMMKQRGMHPFLERPLLGGDFFTYKGHVRTDPNFGAWPPDERVQSIMRPHGTSSRFTLLDAGALVPDLLKKERDWLPDYRQVVQHRADVLSDPDLADLFELVRSTKKAEGGSVDALPAYDPIPHVQNVNLKRARQMMAGGGAVRQWLRGVKGSGIERALDELKQHRTVRGQVRDDAMRAMAETDPDAKRRLAMRDWIDRNVGNYIVRHMGTENDPLEQIMGGQQRLAIRKMAAARVPSHLEQAGPYETSDMTSAMAGGTEGWVREKYPPWLVKMIEQDMPRHYSEMEHSKGKLQIPHATEALLTGQQGKKLSEFDFADRRDQDFIQEYMAEKKRQLAMHEEKYQRRFAAPINVHDIDQSGWDTYMRPKLHGMLDYLAQANLRPEQLQRMQLPHALRASEDWHAALAKKKAELMGDPWSGTTVHKEYPEGWKWVKFDPEHGEEAVSAALKREGDIMGHCIGGYCDDVMSGQSINYSLRDPKGMPHVTLEVAPPTGPSREIPMSRIGTLGLHESLPSIVQIQGKADKPPIPEYHPYIQDFIRSGKFGEVGMAERAGLHRIGSKSGSNYPSIESFPEAERFEYKNLMNIPPEAMQKYLPQQESQLYTAEEIRNALRSVQPEDLNEYMKGTKPKPYADGGSVNYDPHFEEAYAKYADLPRGLLKALAQAESNMNPKAVSKRGARGLMQFMPQTARQYKVNADDPVSSIMGAGQYLTDLKKRFGTLYHALAAYNWGPGNLSTYGEKAMPASVRKYVHSILASLPEHDEESPVVAEPPMAAPKTEEQENIFELLAPYLYGADNDEEENDDGLAYMEALMEDAPQMQDHALN